MDQTFNFRAARVPPWRRLGPRAIVLTVATLALLCGAGSFSRWVIDSERRSIERAEAVDASTSIVGTISGSDNALSSASAVAGSLAVDSIARADARTALHAARRAAGGRATFLDAGPGQLTTIASGLILVDGPSRAPGVVSVDSTRDAWGAAVMGPSGTCYLLRFAPGEGVMYGTGMPCTGAEALAASDTSW